MAIVRENSGSQNTNGASTTITSFNAGSTANTAIVVGSFIVGTTAVSNVKWNGSNITGMTNQNNTTRTTFLYGGAIGTGSTANIVVTPASSSDTYVVAAAYSGVDQTTPFANSAFLASTTSPYTINITLVTGDWTVTSLNNLDNGTSPSDSTNFTLISNSFGNDCFGDSNGQAGNGSVSVTIGGSPNGQRIRRWDAVIKASTGGGGATAYPAILLNHLNI
jgi:hypothetical protein